MTDLLPLADFQLDGARFLADRPHAFLADEMGVGKSAQAVRACDLAGAQQILVLVPASARVNWVREFAKFSPLDRDAVPILDGKMTPCVTGITVCSYDLLASNAKLRKSLLVRRWDVIILDEAHYLKERKSRRTKAVYGRKGDGVGGLAERSRHCWRLSGTPAPNNVSEIWTHLRSAGLYERDWYAFVTEFCTGFDSDYGFKINGTKNADRLKTLLQPFLLRRKKADVMPELPPLKFEHHTVEPSPVDHQIYFAETLMPNGEQRFKAEVERQNALAKTTFNGVKARANISDALAVLSGAASSLGTLRRWIGLSKVPGYLAHVLPELQSGKIKKLVVFAYNVQVIQGVMAGLREFNPVAIYGETPPAKRQKYIDAFQQDTTTRVLVGQLQAAGTAITLTAAHRLDVLQESYVPGENAQAIMRCHRKGQTKPVLVRFFGCARSIDADITRAHMRKADELLKVFS